MQVPDRFWKKFADADLPMRAANPRQEDLAHTRAALAMCENIDWNVGRLLAKLDQLKVASDTIVVYFHDNGPNAHAGTARCADAKAPWTRAASDRLCWSAGREKIPAARPRGTDRRCHRPAPDPGGAGGRAHQGRKTLDGVSLKPLLLGTSHELADPTLFSHWNGRVAPQAPALPRRCRPAL